MGNSNRIGYSPKIDDPAMAGYVKNSNRWSAIFALIIAIAAVAGFYIAGETGSEMENPESLYIGLGIGSMFLLIAIFQIAGRLNSKTWDGIIVDKKAVKKRRRIKDDDSIKEYIEYTIFIRNNNGKTRTSSADDDDTLYNYYQIGDKVRHHKGLNSFEKYDKSKDSIIFCNACASLNHIDDDFCFRCKCPLLK
jgi:hypothetical protein